MPLNQREARLAIRKILAAETRNVDVPAFVDMCVLTMAVEAYKAYGTPDPELADQGLAIIRRGAMILADGFQQLITPLGERSDAGALKPLIQRAGGGSIVIQTKYRNDLFLRMFPWLQNRGSLFQDVFSGRATRPARMLAAAAKEEAPAARLRALAGIPLSPAGVLARRWIGNAAADVGAPVPATAALQADAETAADAAAELGRIQRAIDVGDPMSEETADLQTRRDTLTTQIEEVANTSEDPNVVRATAATTAANTSTSKVARRFGLTQEQEQVVLTRGKVVVAAGAGSGKTQTLVATIAHLVEEEGLNPSQILACSFTRAASAELGERVEKAGIQGADIGTTHSVARAIIKRNRPNLVQVVGKTKEADRLFKMALKQIGMDLAKHEERKNQNQDLINEIESVPRWMTNDFLSSLHAQLSRGKTLSDKQIAALKRFTGSGRWAHDNSDHEVVVRNTRKVAAPPGKGGVSPYWTEPVGEWFNIGVLQLINADGKPAGEKWGKLQVENLKNSRVSVDQARQERGESDPIAALYGAYEWLKQNDPVEGPAMDYTDQLIVALEILQNDPVARDREQRRYKAIMVDEAQDLNDVQFSMFRILGEQADTLSFIGDDKQSIYGFRGAKPANYVDLSRSADFKTRLMTMNFRSGSAIVDAANKLIAHNEDRQIPMVCRADERKGIGAIQAKGAPTHEAASSMVAQEIKDSVAAGSSPKDFGILVRNNAEADMYTLALLTRGVPYRMLKKSEGGYFGRPVVRSMVSWMQIATGAANNNDAIVSAHMSPGFGLDKVFAANLARRARGSFLDYIVQGGEVYDGQAAWMNKRVAEYATAIRRVQDAGTEDSTALVREILSLQGVKGTFEDSLLAMVDEDDLLEEGGGEVTEEAKRAAALAPLRPLNMMAEHFKDPRNMLAFIDKMKAATERTQKKTPQDKEDWKEPAVLVGTVHGWKGLQAKHVYVSMPGGVFPNFRSATLAAQQEAEGEPITAFDEERRLAYVALTRGEETVTVMSPQVNYLGKPSTLSQFVSEACIPVSGLATGSGGGNPGGEVSGAVDEAEGKTAKTNHADVSELVSCMDDLDENGYFGDP